MKIKIIDEFSPRRAPLQTAKLILCINLEIFNFAHMIKVYIKHDQLVSYFFEAYFFNFSPTVVCNFSEQISALCFTLGTAWLKQNQLTTAAAAAAIIFSLPVQCMLSSFAKGTTSQDCDEPGRRLIRTFSILGLYE